MRFLRVKIFLLATLPELADGVATGSIRGRRLLVEPETCEYYACQESEVCIVHGNGCGCSCVPEVVESGCHCQQSRQHCPPNQICILKSTTNDGGIVTEDTIMDARIMCRMVGSPSCATTIAFLAPAN